jgi:hypothetical protein
MRFTLICACNDTEVLNRNVFASPFTRHCQVIVQRGYTNVPKAYNEAMPQAEGDVLIFLHQDVYLPDRFEMELNQSVKELGSVAWGVLGPAGQSATGGYGHVLDRGQAWGKHDRLPMSVDTLDELMLIIRRDTLKFDERMPTHHLIGTDLCLQARAAGLGVYAIRAYCHHNSKTTIADESLWLSADYIMRKWPQYLPIYATVADLRGLDEQRTLRL